MGRLNIAGGFQPPGPPQMSYRQLIGQMIFVAISWVLAWLALTYCSEAWERGAEAREQARQQRMRELGFPEGYTPGWREHLQRFIERRKDN